MKTPQFVSIPFPARRPGGAQLRHKSKLLSLLAVLGFPLFSTAQSFINQNVIGTTGGSSRAGSRVVTWTLGEAVTSQVQFQEILLTQGFQQPDTVVVRDTIVGNIPDPQGENYQFVIFPNPTAQSVTIRSANEIRKTLRYKLFAPNGNLVREARLNEMETTVEMGSLSAGTYVLQLMSDGNFFKFFKIVKL